MRRLLRSASFRFAVVYALLLTVSAAALALFLWWATAGLLDRQTQASIEADAQSLSDRFNDWPDPRPCADDPRPVDPGCGGRRDLPAGGSFWSASRRQPATLAPGRLAQRWLVRTAHRACRHAVAGAGAEFRSAGRVPAAGRARRAGAGAIATAADLGVAVGAACCAGNGVDRRIGGAQPVPANARQCIGHCNGDRGWRLHPKGQALWPG